MSQEGRGCLVGDQGGSDKVAQFKMEGLDHELVENTPNAARIGYELTEIRDDSR